MSKIKSKQLTDLSTHNLDSLKDVNVSDVASGHALVRDNENNWIKSSFKLPTSSGATGQVLKLVSTDELDWSGDTSGISEVSQDTSPELGGDLNVTGFQIVSDSGTDIELNPGGTAGTGSIVVYDDIIPDSNFAYTIGDEDFRFHTFGTLNGAVRFRAKNDHGSQITKGQVVYIKGVNANGETPTVGLAKANSSSTMPAFGLVWSDSANDGAEVQIVTFGQLEQTNTSSLTPVNSTLYVSATTAGALTVTPPASESNYIQNIGKVIKVSENAGIIRVGGAGRTNATPNLNQDKIFIGDSNNRSVSKAINTIELDEFSNTTSGFLKNIVEDSSPQLGEDLDLNNHSIINDAGDYINLDSKFIKIGATQTGDTYTIFSADNSNASGETNNPHLLFEADGDFIFNGIKGHSGTNRMEFVSRTSSDGGLFFKTGSTNPSGATTEDKINDLFDGSDTALRFYIQNDGRTRMYPDTFIMDAADYIRFDSATGVINFQKSGTTYSDFDFSDTNSTIFNAPDQIKINDLVTITSGGIASTDVSTTGLQFSNSATVSGTTVNQSIIIASQPSDPNIRIDSDTFRIGDAVNNYAEFNWSSTLGLKIKAHDDDQYVALLSDDSVQIRPLNVGSNNTNVSNLWFADSQGNASWRFTSTHNPSGNNMLQLRGKESNSNTAFTIDEDGTGTPTVTIPKLLSSVPTFSDVVLGPTSTTTAINFSILDIRQQLQAFSSGLNKAIRIENISDNDSWHIFCADEDNCTFSQGFWTYDAGVNNNFNPGDLVFFPTVYSSSNNYDTHQNSSGNTSTIFAAGGYISRGTFASLIDFTGQHRNNYEIPEENISFGLIVKSSGSYNNLTDNSPQINIDESLPIVSLTTSRNEKSVWGVISSKESEGLSRTYSVGCFNTVFNKDENDNRLIINSVGEGAVWVTNINGDLENGDYITTCEIPGYGMKQDDDLLHNYTVAKITCDCNFDLNSTIYTCEEFVYEGVTYKRAFVGCTYHCG